MACTAATIPQPHCTVPLEVSTAEAKDSPPTAAWTLIICQGDREEGGWGVRPVQEREGEVMGQHKNKKEKMQSRIEEGKREERRKLTGGT